jgi:KaiC/GvpD/RAD55 family RecA-like ATPase
MANQELFDKSPKRLFEKAAGSALSGGEIGLITAKKGLGKTAVLVQFGLDALVQGKSVAHVSFNQNASTVIDWYHDMFIELAKKKDILKPEELLAELVKQRFILNINQDVVSLAGMIRTLKAYAGSSKKTDALFIDDLNLNKVQPEDLKAVSAYAKEAGIAVWISSTNESAELNAAAPAALQSLFDSVLHLAPKGNEIELQILKFREAKNVASSLKLNSKTLLITDK